MTLTAIPPLSPATQAPHKPTPPNGIFPTWAMWHCPVDETYWSNDEGPNCWFCGDHGTIAHPPHLTCQHGIDVED